MNRSTAFLPLIILLVQSAAAQEIFKPSEIQQVAEAVMAISEITIDGILNEPDWNSAIPLTNFVQVEPNQGQLSEHKTMVKVLYSEKHLYVGVFCHDTLGRKAIRVPDMMRDFNWRAHDTFAICFDGFNDKRNSMSFATNPYGTQKDYLSFDDILFDGDWSGLWSVRTSITEKGWYAEFQVPWKTLRYKRAGADSLRVHWNVNFLRLRRASNEISVWSSYPRAFGFNRMEYAGTLSGITPPAPSTNVQVNPYALISYNRQMVDGQATSSNTTFKPGGDVKWVPSTNSTLDLTINTDFAQADADVQVNNVSRFSVLFPEKRQFFLENASLFSPTLVNGKTGGNMAFLPFFSRRVGLSSVGSLLPIDAGVRFINRNTVHALGVMAIRQGKFDTLSTADIFVARYSKSINRKVRLGSIATFKHGQTDGSNLLVGVDGLVRFSSTQSLNFLVSASSANTIGWGGYAQYQKTTNLITAWWTQVILTKDFQPELGFVSRKDVIATQPGIILNLRKNQVPLPDMVRAFQPAATANVFHQSSTGILTESDVKVTPLWFELQNGGYLGASASIIRQDLQSDFLPLGVPIQKGKYDFNRFGLNAGSDPSRKISYALQYDFGNYFNGKLQTADLSLLLIPIPHVSLKASVNANWFDKVGVESTTKQVSLYTLQGRLALNPRVQLIGLFQHHSSNLNSFNLRFAWEYQPLSYIYFVLNSRETQAGELKTTEAQGVIKLSFLKQF